jgi:hypothetical protein
MGKTIFKGEFNKKVKYVKIKTCISQELIILELMQGFNISKSNKGILA